MSRTQRLAMLGVAVVIAVVAVIVIGTSGSGDTKSAGPTTIEVKDAKPVGGVKTLTYKKGDTIDITVKSDTADEVHFHGYDVAKDVDAGGSVRFDMPATIEGEFIMELEEHKQTLVNVKVEPN
jgi:FtsP/CotA-like multicopper oxidase with cupredoxin domain